MQSSSLFIGIDLGTSGVRAMAIDETDTIHGQAVVALPSPRIDGPRVEQDPQIWWTAVCECLKALTSQIDTDKVAAIAVDGTSGTLLLADNDNEPLGPALMYNDLRCAKQAGAIAGVAPANTAAQGASSALAKLLWFYEEGLHEQGLTTEACHAMHQADWIAAKFRITGSDRNVSDANNALKLGYDAEHHCWPQWMLDLLNANNIPHSLLPEVVNPGTITGLLDGELATRFGLPEGTCIVAGTTDSTASFLSTGANDIGEAVTVLGSTLVVKVIADKPIFAPKYGVYSQPLMVNDQQRWLVGGASNSGGAVICQHFSVAQIEEMTPRLQSETPTGLNYYPLPAVGERFPISDPTLIGKLEPRPDDDVIFFQGMLEGIAAIEAKAYHLLETLGAPWPSSVRTTGGGSKNMAWTQMRKHSLNKNTIMVPAAHTEAAFGIAKIARLSGIKPTIQEGVTS